MCGPYGSIAFLRALTAHGRGGVKTPPYGMSFTAEFVGSGLDRSGSVWLAHSPRGGYT